MKIREVDDFVNWFKNNVFDFPQGSENSDVYAPIMSTTTGQGKMSKQANLGSTRAEMDRPTEYDFPLSLLEHILGIDR